MHKNKRDIYGVIAANVADIEQREILSGIISKAQELNIDVAVISNIYNPTETSEVLKAENGIYDLIQSDEFDGLILISEAIINSDVQQRILNNLKKMSHIPIVVLGTPLPDFNLPQFHFINTSDEADMEDITTHLIEHHEFTNIHILTGHHFIDASHKRVKGYQKALEKHGIAFQKENVFFGISG
ncbi:MAG: substrate-binding domain-containing protein [Oscillospiraceae bacterium]